MNELSTKADYKRFMDEFVSILGESCLSEHCFYTYGSFQNGSFNPGRSDIDGGIILNSEAVTNKLLIGDISEGIALAFRKAPIRIVFGDPFQFNLTDNETNRDGRFLSYNNTYTDWIKKHGQVRFGADLREGLNGLEFKCDNLGSAAQNLRSLRNGLLFWDYNLDVHPDKFREATGKAVEKTTKLPKKLFEFQTKEVITDRKDAQLAAQDYTHSCRGLEELNELMNNPQRFDKLLSNPETSLELYQKALTAYETMVQNYIRKHPVHSDREVRQ